MALEWDGPLSFLLQRDNPLPGDDRATGVKNHFHQYVRGRDYFLRGNYDALLFIESDIIPPPDALKKLAALDCDVAYGCYVYRNHENPIVNIYEFYANNPVSKKQRARNMGSSLSIGDGSKWEEAKAKGIVECSGASFGCVLIKRHVMEAIPMRLEGGGHCDTPWTYDAYRWGASMWADTSVICGHKDTDGTILWPS